MSLAFLCDTQLQDWLQSYYLREETVRGLREQFRQVEPFPHLALSDFLQEEKIEQISTALDEEQFFEKESDLFQLMQSNDLAGATQPILEEFREFLMSDAFLQWLEYITHLSFQRNVVDVAGSVYRDTDFLLCHDDRLDQRQIAFMLYLSDFVEGDGGGLQLFASENGEPTEVVRSIQPKYNTFVLFQVREDSFHAVEEVTAKKLRIALNGWFHGTES